MARPFLKRLFICREGEAGDSLLVISRGEVAIYQTNINREGGVGP